MKPKTVKRLLNEEIKKAASNPAIYCKNPGVDFSRKRKLPLDKMLSSIIGMGSGSLTNELIDLFGCKDILPTKSAFVQQRCKIHSSAFKDILSGFTSRGVSCAKGDLRIFAIDGSDLHIPTNPKDTLSFLPGANGQKPYNLLHLNALYDLTNHLYTDATIQKRMEFNEHKAFTELVDRSDVKKALIIADRGYESYNNMAHCQEKGWFFLIRVKDGYSGMKAGFDLPQTDEYDFPISLKLTRKQTKEIKELSKQKNFYKYLAHSSPFDYLPSKSKKADSTVFYDLHFRFVRFQITDSSYETVITNLPAEFYPSGKLKELYAMRWGIETSFRDLKYTIGLVNFHSKKVMCIEQEVYARMIMYNFVEMITSHVVIEKKQRKYIYKANFTVAVHMCRQFFNLNTSSTLLESIIARNVIPIRLNRHRERKLSSKTFQGFLYRVA